MVIAAIPLYFLRSHSSCPKAALHCRSHIRAALKNAVQTHQGENVLHGGLEMREAEGASTTPDIVKAPYQRRKARTVNTFNPFEIHDKMAAALA
jgi:hypothetical protein